MKPIALQLYTVRDKAAKDFPSVLRKVAEIGYKGVEMAGLHGYEVKEIAMVLADLGLQVCSSHTALPTEQNLQEIIDIELALGNSRIITGFGPDHMKTEEQCRICADKFNKAAQLLKPFGMSFGFHNHWWEFTAIDGKYPYEIIIHNTSDVFSQLDVYWAALVGADPTQIIRQHASRIPTLHIKDGTLEKDVPQLPVGSGVLDFPAIIGAADHDVLDWLVVEMDDCDIDMMEAVKMSYDYLTSNGLAEGNR